MISRFGMHLMHTYGLLHGARPSSPIFSTTEVFQKEIRGRLGRSRTITVNVTEPRPWGEEVIVTYSEPPNRYTGRFNKYSRRPLDPGGRTIQERLNSLLSR